MRACSLIILAACTVGDVAPIPVEVDSDPVRLEVAQNTGLKAGLVTGSIYDDLVSHAGERMADIANLGAKILRIEIIDGDVGKYQRIVDAARRYGIEVLAVIQSPAIGFNPNDDIEGYIARYKELVDRLLREIPNLTYIEVENEPDVYDFNPLSGDNVARYARLVKEIYEHYVIHRQNGRPQIVAFDFSRQDQPAFHAVYNHPTITNHRNYFRQLRGLPDGLPCDIVSIHGYGDKTKIPNDIDYAYGGKTMSDATGAFVNMQFDTAPTARTDDQAGNRSIINRTPVWYTEIGHEWTEVGGQGRQAEGVHQAFQTLRQYPQITAAFWYDYRDDEAGGVEEAGLRGNRSTGYAQHESWWAYQQEARGGNRATFVDVPPDHWAYPWIEAMYARGITKGCAGRYEDGTLQFCDQRPVTVDEVRVLIGRAQGGSPDGPYESIYASRGELARQLAGAIGAYGNHDGRFADVGPDHELVHQIYGLAQRISDDGQPVARGTEIRDADGVTRLYFSPGNHLSRAEASAFLARAYNLH